MSTLYDKERRKGQAALAVVIIGCLVIALVLRYSDVADAAQIRRKAAPAAAVVQPAQKIFDGSFRKKILVAVVKHHTVNKLQTEGLKGKKLSRAEAEAAWEKLTPDLIDGAIAEASPEAAAQVAAVGGPLTNFLDWLSTHSDQIMKIVELIIKILALFG